MADIFDSINEKEGIKNFRALQIFSLLKQIKVT